MNRVCNDIRRLFIHRGNAAVTYASSSLNRKHCTLCLTEQYMKESRRRLTVVKKHSSQEVDNKFTSWIPYLPNGLIEGVEHATEEYQDGTAEYEIVSYRNNLRHGLSIIYHTHYVYVMTYVDGRREGLEQIMYYTGVSYMKRLWNKGTVKTLPE